MFRPSIQSGPFSRYHQILFWPLEVTHEGTGYDIGEIAGRISNRRGEPTPGTNAGPWARIPETLDRGTADEHSQYAEFVYFHPFVQRFLYRDPGRAKAAHDSEHRGLELLHRTDVGRVRVSLDMGRGNPAVEETLDVNRVHLYLFRTQVAILVVEVSADRQIERESVLALENQLRRAYPPYWDDRGKDGAPCYVGGQCPRKVEWLDRHGVPVAGLPVSNYEDAASLISRVRGSLRPPIADHWQALLPAIGSEMAFEHIEDDRNAGNGIPAVSRGRSALTRRFDAPLLLRWSGPSREPAV